MTLMRIRPLTRLHKSMSTLPTPSRRSLRALETLVRLIERVFFFVGFLAMPFVCNRIDALVRVCAALYHDKSTSVLSL
jgi:hypothetical protein